ncbi:GIN domain-containing protein [Actinotalea sp. K2]|uniref:GIN domain-containing protein n=1 Tax=Actinotalea sp. K2 TaxID=2939438 RepID=UPI002016B572|nr:DUF2807 domain-containing protein [Actinotalea sp. K2]MCL3862451.1 DUF2807 domain-containing protein [Actinotalea sp. K2]
MTQRPLRPLLTVTMTGALALVLAGCGALSYGSSSVDVGPSTTEEREISDVTGVELATSGTVTIEHGDGPALTVTAGEKVLPHLTSEVRDGVLVLGTTGGSRWGIRGPISYHLVLEELDAISIRGSGDVHADAASGDGLAVTVSGSGDARVQDVAVDDVAVEISGSGDVELAGVARRQQISISGSGRYAGGGVSSDHALVAVRGSGGVAVDVTGTLDVVISGSGSVTHTGGAQVTSTVVGSGSVRQG